MVDVGTDRGLAVLDAVAHRPATAADTLAAAAVVEQAVRAVAFDGACLRGKCEANPRLGWSCSGCRRSSTGRCSRGRFGSPTSTATPAPAERADPMVPHRYGWAGVAKRSPTPSRFGWTR